jgi:transmembrane sensor
MTPRSPVPAAEAEPPIGQAAGVWCMRLSEGPLEPGQQAEFEAWLSADPRHRPALDEAVATWREVDGAESGPEFLPLRLEALNALRRAGRRPGLRRWAAAAAAVLVVIMAGAGGLWLAARPRTYETGIGERRVVVLADGSKISLDAATRVDVSYRHDGRALQLEQGRAKFDVAKDPLRPFSVAAGDETVVATGTEFSVELVRRQVRVVLYEGHVAVLGPSSVKGAPQPVRLAARAAPADQLLLPGRELVMNASAQVATVAAADPIRTLAWEGGQLVFVDEPLATAVERVNRYSDAKLAVGDAAAGQVLVTGVFTAGDTRAFVEGVTAVFPVRTRERDGVTEFVGKGG